MKNTKIFKYLDNSLLVLYFILILSLVFFYVFSKIGYLNPQIIYIYYAVALVILLAVMFFLRKIFVDPIFQIFALLLTLIPIGIVSFVLGIYILLFVHRTGAFLIFSSFIIYIIVLFYLSKGYFFKKAVLARILFSINMALFTIFSFFSFKINIFLKFSLFVVLGYSLISFLEATKIAKLKKIENKKEIEKELMDKNEMSFIIKMIIIVLLFFAIFFIGL